MIENEVSGQIVDAAYKLHSIVGPGLLESAYQQMMVYELEKRGLVVLPEHPIALIYDGVFLNEEAYRADLIVANKVIVELKSVEQLAPVHKKQVLTYLRLSGLHLGLLINFGGRMLKDNVVRIVDKLPE
jgi:GxxExxY protein